MDMEELTSQFNEAVAGLSENIQGMKLDGEMFSSLDTEKLDKRFEGIPGLDELEKTTNLPKSVLVGGFTVLALIFTIISFNVKFLGVFTTNLIGFAFPAYASIKAIESERKDDDTKWLTYWVVYSYFYLSEMLVIGPLAQMSAFGRTYFLIKVLVLVWCQFGGGASILYTLFVYPVTKAFFKSKNQIEAWLEQYEDYNNEKYYERQEKLLAEDSDDE